MIPRLVKRHVDSRLRVTPAVCLLGPRQCGKTTLAKSMTGHTFDMEDEQDRIRLDLQWDELCRGRELVIIDEAQTAPEFFPRLRGAIDARRKLNGRFLLLGSVAPALMRGVAESLAGRIALIEVGPFIVPELPPKRQERDLWFCGGYPDGGILRPASFPSWQNDYLQLLAQRDLPQWGLAADPRVTLRFFKMLAALHGQIWNASEIGASLGISYHTVNSYLGYLEHAYLIRVLQPLSINLKKRIIKSPKVYWRDSGLLHALNGLTEKSQLLNQPWVGASFEGWVIEQIIGFLHASGKNFSAHYLRTSDQHEIDLILQYQNTLWAFEIKLTSAPSHESYLSLEKRARDIRAEHICLICQTSNPVIRKKSGIVTVRDVLELLG